MTFQILDIQHLSNEELVKHARVLRAKRTLKRIDPREEQQLAFLEAEGRRRAAVIREERDVREAREKRLTDLRKVAMLLAPVGVFGEDKL